VFFGIESNPAFVKQTKKRCPDVKVFEDSAANIMKYLEKYNLTGCDRIISGLPWANFPKELQQELMSAIINALNPGGKLIQFAYFHGLALPNGQQFKKILDKNFTTVTKTKLVWVNLPPAFVYTAVK